MQTFHRLVYCHQARGQYEAAIQYAWQWVALDPWQEEAQQQLMYLLAISGQRTTALAQYKTCCRLLREELGVEPAEETTRLYEQIRDRRLSERERFFSLLPLRLAQDRPAPPALRL
jgi:DNA-binding SARP family transcriptional activator